MPAPGTVPEMNNRLILMGGTAGPELAVESPGTVDEFMAKPYNPAELADRVRSLLAASGASGIFRLIDHPELPRHFCS